MTVRVKICGVTRWEDARLACDLGAAALGFNFYEKSPRATAPSDAWAMVRRLPPFVASVGVFVNWRASAVLSLARALRFTAVQLHGDEPHEDIAAIAAEFPVIRAIRVPPASRRIRIPRRLPASAFLLDAARTGQFGGTGAAIDWRAARSAARSHRIILAGGLNPANVAQAIREVRPFAVDAASGVESRPGRKDAGKLREFFAEVARANRELALG